MSIQIEDVFVGAYKNVWIYGSGKTGKKLVQSFHFLDVAFNGMVVSKKDGTCISGVTIMELDDLHTASEDTVFLITASEKFHGEIIEGLEVKGYHNYVCWDSHCLCELWKLADYEFIDRRKTAEKCCFILAGYKEFLWDSVFERFEKFIPADVQVCIISSGVYREKLALIAEQMDWSYLATKKNSVTLVQNVAFALYENYKWLYKVDEDIFVTKDSFKNLFNGFVEAEEKERYVPGITVPLIPVNGYGYSVILDKLSLSDEYKSQFGDIKIGGNPDSEIEKNPETAAFMWTKCLQIDELNRLFQTQPYGDNSLNICGVRFSIGFILMKHTFWSQMQGFSVSGNTDMGTDEEELCAECINKSKVIVVCGNSVVGHFAFGRQTDRMKVIYEINEELFSVK